MYTFAELLMSGRIGKIHLGYSINMVIEVLGLPNDISVHKKPLIYKYGILELVFDFNEEHTDKLLTRFTILICDIEHQYVPVLFNKFDWFPNIHTTPMELEKYLLAHNMIWTILPSPWNQEEDWQLIYKVGEAIIAFDNNGLCYIAT